MCGEHMVMYGRHALSTSLNLRTTVEFGEVYNNPTIQIHFPAVDLSLNIPLQLINNFISSENYRYLADDSIMLLKHVQYFITVNGLWKTYEQRFSMQTFFFLLLYMCYHQQIEMAAFNMLLTTEIPIGSGLGSSSSFAVCLAACFLHWGRLQRGCHNAFTNDELKSISEYAMISEAVIQNYMFETDHDVCTNGYMTLFRYKELIDSIVHITNVPEMDILLIDSKYFSDKQEQMRKVAVMKNLHGNTTDVILNKIDNVSMQVFKILSQIKDCQRANDVKRLEELYKMLNNNIILNQDMLKNLNLSNQSLERIFAIAKHYGFAGKLTGFIGVYAYILLPPNISEEHFSIFWGQLQMAGFNPILTKINSCGVRIEHL